MLIPWALIAVSGQTRIIFVAGAYLVWSSELEAVCFSSLVVGSLNRASESSWPCRGPSIVPTCTWVPLPRCSMTRPWQEQGLSGVLDLEMRLQEHSETCPLAVVPPATRMTREEGVCSVH